MVPVILWDFTWVLYVSLDFVSILHTINCFKGYHLNINFKIGKLLYYFSNNLS
jgi:hypothetical protein